MSHKSKKRTAKFSFVLDDTIALEALILNRLATLPASRKNSWLQSLLVRGFCAECAEIQALQQSSSDNARYIPGMSPAVPTPAREDKALLAEMTQRAADAANRPGDAPVAFSALKAVVG